MGEQRKKTSGWRLGALCVLSVLACLMLVVGTYLVDFELVVARIGILQPMDTTEKIYYWGTKDGIRAATFSNPDDFNRVYHITSASELAYMSYVFSLDMLSGTEGDYSRATFILDADIYLNEMQIENYLDTRLVYPIWTPIDAGDKHINITFDGNGNSIIGMKLEYTDSTNHNLGFFSSLTGGVIQNVTFVDPIISYHYTGESVAANDPDRPNKPTDICMGVIAGATDSTYINNVNIVNPKIEVVTDNVNAHNFYVGTAVGKMSFTSEIEDGVEASINTVTPTKWGLDGVNVSKVNQSAGAEESVPGRAEIKLTVNAGEGEDLYGHATYGYLGGLVGANISSKIINSNVQNLTINPDFDAEIAGTYYIGGLTGLITQVVSSEELLTAAGLYNNILNYVNLIQPQNFNADDSNCVGGKLVGYIYSGGWVYNNLIIGEMPFGTPNGDDKGFWGKIENRYNYVVMDNPDCIGHMLGSLDRYYFNDLDMYIGDSDCRYATYILNPSFIYCTTHQGQVSLQSNTYDNMADYNFYFTSADKEENEEFAKFIAKNEKYPTDETRSDFFSIFDLMGNVNFTDGSLYRATLPILEYEIGLTVNASDASDYDTEGEIKQEAKAYRQLMESVYQFKMMTLRGEEIIFGDYLGVGYEITFVANSDSNPLTTAYFNGISSDGFIFSGEMEITFLRTYQQLIIGIDAANIECPGYEFVGWKIEGYENKVGSNPYYRYLNNDGTYNFAETTERMSKDTHKRRFVAYWTPKQYQVTYKIRDYDSDNQPIDSFYADGGIHEFGTTINAEPTPPVSDKGLVFVGWFTEYALPEPGEDAQKDSGEWRFGQDGTTVPVPTNEEEGLVLYAGWINNFTVLNLRLDNETYIKYYKNYKAYFRDDLGEAFYTAYKKAYDARAVYDYSNTSELLEDLETTFAALRVDLMKLLELPAFKDKDCPENTCPFLYDYAAYLNYLTYKSTVEKYVYGESNDDVLSNIEAYIKNYERLTELFESLQDNLKESVKAIGGVDSTPVTSLIAKYRDLEEKYAALDGSKFTIATWTAFETAAQEAEKLWTVTEPNLVFKDVESAVNAYQTAYNNLKLKTGATLGGAGAGTGTGEDGEGDGLPSAGLSPIMLAVIVVMVLIVAVGGYIGFDMLVLNKRRVKKSAPARNSSVSYSGQNSSASNGQGYTQSYSQSQVVDDDDTYI